MVLLLHAAVGTISNEELVEVAKENADSRPMSFNSKGPTFGVSTIVPAVKARKLSAVSNKISFASDPNYEMKIEVKNRIKGVDGADSLGKPVNGESDDMEKVTRRNLRH